VRGRVPSRRGGLCSGEVKALWWREDDHCEAADLLRRHDHLEGRTRSPGGSPRRMVQGVRYDANGQCLTEDPACN
jgi:hypothetical protein